MVFYFTGTGNSLYIARRIDKDAVSIPQVMRGQERTFTDEAIGVVSPVYGHEMPAMVKDWRPPRRQAQSPVWQWLRRRSGTGASVLPGLRQTAGLHPYAFDGGQLAACL